LETRTQDQRDHCRSITEFMATNSLISIFQSRVHLRRSFYVAWFWTFFIVGAAAFVAGRSTQVGINLATTLCVMTAYISVYMGFSFTSLRKTLSHWLNSRPSRIFLFAGSMIGLYFIYAFVTGAFNVESSVKMVAFVTLPILVAYFSKENSLGCWQDWLIIILIWLPFDARWLSSIWSWPKGEGAYIINTIVAVDLALVIFICFKKMSAINFNFNLNLKAFKIAALYFMVFCFVALPISFVSGFVRWNPDFTITSLLLTPLGIFFFIAIPEELLFRGIIQNLIGTKSSNKWFVIGLASLFFGLTHLNNGEVADLRYAGLATFAGIIYGHSYVKSKGLLVPVLIHTAVDSVWILFLFNGIR
jgi:uncharacterized protein